LNQDLNGGLPATQRPLVERRQQERRIPKFRLGSTLPIDVLNRRMGLGRRWDDWRRKQ